MGNPVIVEQDFDAPVDALWDAISRRDQMVQWYFEQIEAFKPEVGFETSFSVPVDGREFAHQWRVTEAVPKRRLAYTWQYEGIDGDGRVLWELESRGSGSFLRLTNEGLETFPRDDPLFTREACEGGWNYFICDSLKSWLDRQQG